MFTGLNIFINDTPCVKTYTGLAYHPHHHQFDTTKVLLLIDAAIQVQTQTAWTSLISHFSVCFLPFDAA